MIPLETLRGQAVGVFGLGKAGMASVDALLAGGAEVWAWDDDQASCVVCTSREHHKLSVASFSQWPWDRMACLVLAPGVPLTHPVPHPVVMHARHHRCTVIGDIELLWRACPNARFIGITGTNGKSTTTTLIHHILSSVGLKTQVGGNLGTPALALELLGNDGTYIIETSSYQLDLLEQARFNIAAFLNITPDHLDRHGSMDGYVAAKMHLFDRQQAGDVAVIAIDDDYTRAIAHELNTRAISRVVSVSALGRIPNGVSVEEGVLFDDEGAVFDLRGIHTLTGRHNWQNAAVAFAVARACGVGKGLIYQAMKSFQGLAHRMQLVAILEGVRFINDSKATNADATANALAPYQHIYWIAGGKAKAGGIENLKPFFGRIRHAFLIGEAEEAFAQTLQGNVAFTRSGHLEQAVHDAAEMAWKEAKEGAVVLLSPACASFDQWRNFEQRGEAFCAFVQRLNPSENGETRHAV